MIPGESIRNAFPIFLRDHPSGQPLAYLDNAATTQKPQMVLDAIQQYYTQQNANVGRGIYDLAYRSSEAYEACRNEVAAFVGAKPDEICFTAGCTDSINTVAYSYLRPILQSGDNVVVSIAEHHANFIPWQQLCLAVGAEFRVCQLTENGELDQDQLAALIDERTALVAVVHVSNTTGGKFDISKIVNKANRFQIPVLLDVAQSILSSNIDVTQLGVSFLAFSAHKMFGPTGIGILYVDQDYHDKMQPFRTGGGIIKAVEVERTSFNDMPTRLEPGTPHMAGAAGLRAAIRFIEKVGKEAIATYIQKLANELIQALQEKEHIRVLPYGEVNQGIVSFSHDLIHPHDFSTILDRHGIAIRAGHHCTEPLMRYFEVPGTVRVSFGLYNTSDEVNRLIMAIDQTEKMFKI